MRHLTFITLIFLTGCNGKTNSNDEVDPNSGIGLVKSINDTVIYYFNPTTREANFVMNLKYHKNDYYTTKISNDSLELGETFIGEVILNNYNGQIIITHPVDTLVDSRISNVYSLLVKYEPKIKGIFEFKGKVSYDSVDFPFDYKFIVVVY